MSAETKTILRRCSKKARALQPAVIDGKPCLLVPLTKGLNAIIDAEDGPKVEGFCWMAIHHRNTYYAMRHIRTETGLRHRFWMHQLICPTPEGMTVDHRNRNGLDNRRVNLRAATNGEQRLNTRKAKNTSSRFRGVSRTDGLRNRKPWIATITINGEHYWLGGFDSEELAAEIYDWAATAAWGELATTNFEKSRYLNTEKRCA